MDILTVTDGSFSYGDTPVFKEITLRLPRGATLCLLGPNGCGKTTFIGALLGIHPLAAGEITLDGKNLGTLSPRQVAGLMAYVPQKQLRHFSFSVMDVLLMGRTPYTSFFDAPGPEDRKMAGRVLAMFGLSHLKNRDYTLLSGGETQLVMIMRALVQDTPIIIMDEPTAHLDFKHELLVLETIAMLVKQQQKTLVMATHFPNHAFYLENKGIEVDVAFMHQGAIVQAGPPSEALTPDNLERFYGIRAFVASHPHPGAGVLKQVIPVETIKENR